MSTPPADCPWNKVSDFIKQPADEVRAIVKIPISVTNSPDIVIWNHTKNGSYTVKSGYAQAYKAKAKTPRPSSSHYHPTSSGQNSGQPLLFQRYVISCGD